jgi:hypothetical protein
VEQPGLRSDDPDFAIMHFDTLRQRAQVIAAVAAAVDFREELTRDFR